MMPPRASYRIDPAGRIAWIDDAFAALAREHGCPELAQAATGRPLLEFVAGERPRALQQALIRRARAAYPEPIELRYRCDSPTMRRHAMLLAAADPEGGVTFTTWFESTEKRAYLSVLDPDVARGEGLVTLCAWCNRLDGGTGWREADEAAALLAQADAPPAVEHGLCEICELLLTGRPGAGPTRSGPSGRP